MEGAVSRLNRKTRTGVLLFVAIAMIAVGLVSALALDGWQQARTLQDPARPPLDPDATPFVALQVVEGIPRGMLGRPAHIVVSHERIFVADALATGDVIKVFAHNGEFVTSFGTVARDGLAEVMDITLDSAGNLVVLDAAPAVHVFAADGTPIRRFDLTALADRHGVLWVKSLVATEEYYYVLSLDRLVRLDRAGRLVALYPASDDPAALGVAASEFYMGPSGLAASAGVVWLGDAVNGRLLGLGAGGKFDGEITLPAVQGTAPYPTSVAVDALGNLVVVDSARQVLVSLSVTGRVLWEQRITGAEQITHAEVADVAVSPQGDLFVSNSAVGTISRLSLASGRPSAPTVLIRSRAEFVYPLDVALTSEGMFVLTASPAADGQHQVWFRAVEGGASRIVLRGLSEGAIRLAIDNGLMYVLTLDKVEVFTLRGEKVRVTGDTPQEWGSFRVVHLFGESRGPQGLYIDAAGRLLVADTFNHRVVVFSPQGEFLQEITFTTDVWPGALASAADGSLLVLNTFGGQVLRVDALGQLSAVYASPGTGFGQLSVVEDHGRLDGPRDLLADAEGNFYVLDTYNSRIVKFTPTGEALYAVGSFGSETGSLYFPTALAFGKQAGQVWVVDTYNHRLQLLQLR